MVLIPHWRHRIGLVAPPRNRDCDQVVPRDSGQMGLRLML